MIPLSERTNPKCEMTHCVILPIDVIVKLVLVVVQRCDVTK